MLQKNPYLGFSNLAAFLFKNSAGTNEKRKVNFELKQWTNCPLLFNPLFSHSKQGNTYDGTSQTVKWNRMRKQLYNATMLIITAWNAKPGTALFDIKNKIELQPNSEPDIWLIKSINTILKNTSMREIIDKLNEKNNIRKFNFDLLIERLNKEKIQQHFEP